MPDINEIVDRQRELLAARDKALLDQISADYKKVSSRVLADFLEISAKIRKAEEAGEDFSPSWIFQRNRLVDLMAQAQAEFNRFSISATAETSAEQLVQLNMSEFHFIEMAAAQLKDAGGSVGVTFNRLPIRAVEGIVARSSDGSPLKDLFDRLGPDLGSRLRDELIQSVAIGQAPRTTASRIKDILAGNEARAQLIARTETIQAYREGAHLTSLENREVLDGWIWITALDGRACAACIALNGTHHPIDERMACHPACRCTKRFDTKSWAELGIKGVGETRPPPVESGQIWFRKVSRETQDLVLGKKGAKAYRDFDVNLSDFVGLKQDARWGPSYFQRAFKDAIQGPQPGVVLNYTPLIGTLKPPPLPTPAVAQPPPITVELPKPQTAEQARAKLEAIDKTYDALRKDLTAQDLEVFKRKQEWREKFPIISEREAQSEYQMLKARGQLIEKQLAGIDAARIEDLRRVMRVSDPIEFKRVVYGEPHSPLSLRNISRYAEADQERIKQGIDDFKTYVSRELQPADAFNRVDVLATDDVRSFQTGFSINMSARAPRDVVVHELGHWLEEQNSTVHRRILDFYEARTKGEATESLRDLTGLNFNVWERTKKDKFIDAYMGTWYSRAGEDVSKVVDRDFNQYATEVLSMGVQLFHKDPLRLAREDPEYFDVIYNILRNVEPKFISKAANILAKINQKLGK